MCERMLCRGLHLHIGKSGGVACNGIVYEENVIKLNFSLSSVTVSCEVRENVCIADGHNPHFDGSLPTQL